MSEEKSSPKKFWDNALRTVKGENTTQLIEQFTSEMTLVAEGLYEDQGKLHQKMEEMESSSDRDMQSVRNNYLSLESELSDMQSQTADKFADIYTRLQNLEKKVADNSAKESGKNEKKHDSFMRQLTVIVALVAGAAVIIAIISLFH